MRTARARGIRLSVGNLILLGSLRYRIVEHDTAHGSLLLQDDDGHRHTQSIEAIVGHPDLGSPHGGHDRRTALAVLMDKRDYKLAEVKMAHVNEAETGFRSGHPSHAVAGEPRTEYDPQTTTLTQRRLTKALELDSEVARLAGIKMSYITLRRYGAALGAGEGLEAFLDFRKIRRSNGRTSISPEIEEACWNVFATLDERSNLTKTGIATLVLQRLVALYGGNDPVEIRKLFAELPHRRSIIRWFDDHFLASELVGKARTRETATVAPEGGYIRVNPTHPGELVLLDTYNLDVLLKSTRFAGIVRGYLIVALDWFSRSIVAIRIVESAETALDVAWVLREISRPKQMRPNWPAEARWPFAGIPDQLLADLMDERDMSLELQGADTGPSDGDSADDHSTGAPSTGAEDTHTPALHNVSGQPFVEVDSIVVDHGGPYKSYRNMGAAYQHGISVLPARKLTPSDKAIIERFFRSLRTMLLQYLRGYRGSDVSERARATDGNVRYTAKQLEDVIALWAVRIWQVHPMEGVRPPGEPEGEWSPNKLYQYGISRTGIGPRAMCAADAYGIMEAKLCKIDDRGVKVNGLWYDDDNQGILANVRRVKSPYGGKYKGKWPVRYEPSDLNWVYLYGPDEEYIPLRWVGAVDDMPPFSVRDVEELNLILQQRRIAPESTEEITYILLTEILQAHEPIDSPAAEPLGSLNQPQQNASRAARQRELASSDQKRRLTVDPLTGETIDPATGEIIASTAPEPDTQQGTDLPTPQDDTAAARARAALDVAMAKRRHAATEEATAPTENWNSPSLQLLGGLTPDQPDEASANVPAYSESDQSTNPTEDEAV